MIEERVGPRFVYAKIKGTKTEFAEDLMKYLREYPPAGYQTALVGKIHSSQVEDWHIAEVRRFASCD